MQVAVEVCGLEGALACIHGLRLRVDKRCRRFFLGVLFSCRCFCAFWPPLQNGACVLDHILRPCLMHGQWREEIVVGMWRSIDDKYCVGGTFMVICV